MRIRCDAEIPVAMISSDTPAVTFPARYSTALLLKNNQQSHDSQQDNDQNELIAHDEPQ